MLHTARGRSVQRAALFLFGLTLFGQTQDELALKSKRAKELMGDERFAEAVPIYQDLVKALPGNPGLRLNLGMALQMSGRQTEAIPEFERVLKADPNSMPALMSMGASYLALGQPAKALPSLEKVVALQPNEANSRGLLANALLAVDRPKDAAVHFRKLTAVAAGDPKAWFGLGRCYESLSTKAFAELTKKGEGSGEWLALVADSRAGRRQFRAAFYFYKQALEKSPKLRGAHAGLAEVYKATDHADWAAVEAKREAELGAVNCAAEKAECDFRAGKFLEVAGVASAYWQTRAYNELAVGAFGKLAALPESVELHSLLADVAAGRGQFLDAAKEWRAAMKLDPADSRLVGELAAALFQGRDYAGAVPLLEELLKKEPASAEWNYYLGESYLRLEKPDRALEYLETSAKLEPGQLPVRAALGLTLMRLDRAKDAVGHLEASVSIDEDGSLHYQLAKAYQAAGDGEGAKAAMADYQKILAANEAAKQDLEEKVKITEP